MGADRLLPPRPLRLPAAVAVAALWVACVLRFGLGPETLLGALLAALLVVVSLIDLERRIIPNVLVGPAAAAALGIVLVLDPASLPERIASAVLAGGFLLVPALLRPSGMGMGDVKLVGTMGLFLGASVAVALLTGLVAGVAAGAAIMARRGLGARKATVPFGPFLALGGLVGLFAGDPLLDAYLDASDLRSG